MHAQSVRARPWFCGALVLVCLGLLGGCAAEPPDPGPEPQPTPEAPPDPKQALLDSVPDARAEDFHFALREEDGRTTTTLTNKALAEPVTLGADDAGMVLRYTRIEEEDGGDATTYKTEITRRGPSLELVVADIASGKLLHEGLFEPPGAGCNPPGQFDTLEACIEEFDCSMKGAVLCQANKTCQPQFVGLTCCLKDGTRFSVHLLVPPTSRRCQLVGSVISDLGSFVLSRD